MSHLVVTLFFCWANILTGATASATGGAGNSWPREDVLLLVTAKLLHGSPGVQKPQLATLL